MTLFDPSLLIQVKTNSVQVEVLFEEILEAIAHMSLELAW